MSLIGIDIGTSSVKVAVYSVDGELLADSRVALHTSVSQPGWEEADPETVWNGVLTGLKQVSVKPAIGNDPPQALAISASGDEVFPIGEKGEVLGPCLLSGDIRGGEFESRTSMLFQDSEWYNRCGHIPERMDPVNRLVWWRTQQPGIFSRAAYMWGWHEYLTYRLCGCGITDPTLASKWLIYDMTVNDWSEDMLNKFSIERRMLPKIQSWKHPVGVIFPSLADEIGLPRGVTIGVGSYDSTCSALGSGAFESGTLGLACGSWEVAVAPCDNFVLNEHIVGSNMPVVPYAGESPFAILAQSPNGAHVADWITTLLDISYNNLFDGITDNSRFPSTVAAIPHLSGTISPWKDGRDSRAAIFGMTLATNRVDVVKAFLEGVAYDLVITTDLLHEMNIPVNVLRASGGGTKSAWWMQLKSDLTGIPVETAGEPEPGAFGAALLAGMSAGIYKSINETPVIVKNIAQRFEPDLKRKELHSERLEIYKEAVQALIPLNRRLFNDSYGKIRI